MMSTNQLLFDIFNKLNTEYTYLNVFKFICNKLNINYIAALQKNKNFELVEVRYIFAYVIRCNTNDSFKNIGEFLGINHATVLHGLKNITKLYKEKNYYNEHTKKIKNIIEQTEKQFFVRICYKT